MISAADATALAMLLMAVLPVAVLAAVGALALDWSRHDAAVIAASDGICGFVLVEWVLRDWRMVPFTCARGGDADSLKSRWLAHIVPLLLFAFGNAAMQKAIVRSDRAAAWYLGAALVAWGLQRLRRRCASRDAPLQFHTAPSDAMSTLDLSEAIG